MAKNYTLIPYRELDHGTFDEEWPPHKNLIPILIVFQQSYINCDNFHIQIVTGSL